MHLLYPIGLFALSGLIIPLVIHLWSIKKGKTLKIGSIALLGESSRISAKSFRVTEWPLLILRTLLLSLLVFILARPYLKKVVDNKKQGGWVLVEKSKLRLAFESKRKSLDSLLNAGYELHQFDIGFNRMSLKDTLNSDTLSTVAPLPYASLIKQLNTLLPAGSSVYLYADHNLNRSGEEVPKIAFDLKWVNLKPVDTVKKWFIKFVNKTYEGTSSPSLTTYKVVNAAENIPLISAMVQGQTNPADARYIKAVLRTISDFTKRKIVIKDWNRKLNEKADIGFWLSDQQIDPIFLSAIKKGGRLFSYEKGKVAPLSSTVDVNHGSKGNLAAIELNQRIITSNYGGQELWTDGFGEPVLSLEKLDAYDHYHFYSRINPQWTDLPWNGQFVKALMPIVIGYNGRPADFAFEESPADQRRLAANQKDVMKADNSGPISGAILDEPLNKIFWVFAFLIFIIERVLSFRKKTIVNYV